jgi:hypothetical protein
VREPLLDRTEAAGTHQAQATGRHLIRAAEGPQAVGPELRDLRVGIIPAEGPAVEAIPAAEPAVEEEGTHARGAEKQSAVKKPRLNELRVQV